MEEPQLMLVMVKMILIRARVWNWELMDTLYEDQEGPKRKNQLEVSSEEKKKERCLAGGEATPSRVQASKKSEMPLLGISCGFPF